MTRAAFIVVLAASLFVTALPSLGREGDKQQEPVRLTPDQVAILSGAADALAPRRTLALQKLKGLQNEVGVAQVRSGLLDVVTGEEQQVKRTQEAFEKFSRTEPALEASRIFFADILQFYSDARGGARFASMNEFPNARDHTLNIYDHAAAAYKTAAMQESLTFDLEIDSSPPLASVSLRRQGDAYERQPKVTTTTIRNLVLARWLIKVELQGYVTEERTHDPFRDRNNSLHFSLRKK